MNNILSEKIIDIKEKYKNYCERKGILYQLDDKVNPYDDTTLFCPAGMQQFKQLFKNERYTGTIANIQSCIRMNDFEEIGDVTHLLYFNMMGLFSFREMTLQTGIDFWMEFLKKELMLNISYVTVHPDKTTGLENWISLYENHNMQVKLSDDCKWSDGEIGGYCTEFFIDDVEIGNIVNPLGSCIDVGFGLERLEMFVNGRIITKEQTLKETILKIISSGYKPSNLKQGYILRKLLRELWKIGSSIEHEFFTGEIERQKRILVKYEKLKDKHLDKPKEWWFDTHGINLDEIN
jgi:alanyl-tRNA synthetase